MRSLRVRVGFLGVMLGLAAGVVTLRAADPTKGKAKKAADTVWTIGIYAGPTPFALQPIAGDSAPAFTAAESGEPEMDIVAHPFLAVEGGRFHLFFTAKSSTAGWGAIGLAESSDAVKWTYRGIVLRERAVLSYPCVFKADGDYYLLPETTANALRLYRATRFPDQWAFFADVITGDKLVSPTVVRHGGGWWLFVGGSNAMLRLFYADTLKGPWKEHPRSPVVANDANIARPAGRPLIIDGKLYRLAQDCEPTYGNQVVAFEITTLTPTDYQERAVEQPLVRATGAGWNAAAMHHVDAHRVGPDRWIAAVDARGAPVPRPAR